MFAVIETGGKQYRVEQGSVLRVEKMDGAIGDQLVLSKVLMVSNEGRISIGTPYISGSTVDVTILNQDRDRKIRIFKFKVRKRYRRTKGHRQFYSKILVDSINIPSHGL